VLICGGSINYIGAITWPAKPPCAWALVWRRWHAEELAAHSASKLTEATYAPLPESEPGVVAEDAIEACAVSANADVLLLGCAWAERRRTGPREVAGPGTTRLPSLVLDADALNCWPSSPVVAETTSRCYTHSTPGEMSRLTGLSVAEVQSRRLSVAEIQPCHAEDYCA